MMHGLERSDPFILAKKPANKSGQPEAESVERREGTKENTAEPPMDRTQSRGTVTGGLDRVRQKAKGNKAGGGFIT